MNSVVCIINMSSEKLLTVLQCWPSQVCVDPLKMSFHLTQWQLWSSGLLFSLVTKSIFSSNKHDRKKCGPRLIIRKDFITYLKCHVLLHWKLRAKAKISTLTQDLSRLNKHHAGGRKLSAVAGDTVTKTKLTTHFCPAVVWKPQAEPPTFIFSW